MNNLINWFFELPIPNALGLVAMVGLLAGCVAIIITDKLVSLVVQRRIAGVDEFADTYDAFAVATKTRIAYFQSLDSMYAWAQENIPNVFARAEFTLACQHNFEHNDRVGFLCAVKPTDDVVIKSDDEFRQIDLKSFTCTTCVAQVSCAFAFDLFNTDGACLDALK